MESFSFIVSLIVGFLLAVLFTGLLIPALRRHQFGQFIRKEGPKSHLRKEGTPSMGGIAIYAAVVLATFIGSAIGDGKARLMNLIVIVIVGLLFGIIGFIDDYIKVAAKHNLGLKPWQKLVLQILFAVLFASYVMQTMDGGTDVWIPFIDRTVDFGVWYIPFASFVLVAMANSVNLTDGLDGLCAGTSAIFAVFFAIFGLTFDSTECGFYMMSIAGACIGFLVYNRYPAKIFMGDTGSMALGGGMTAAIMLSKSELLIPFAGLIFVLEAVSVILQVVYYKATKDENGYGKRLFRMAPLHHHFELGGMHEKKVVWMFCSVTLVCCIISAFIVRI